MKNFWFGFWPFLLSVLGGVLLAWCFAPFNLADLVWFAPICWLAAVWFGKGSKRPKRRAFSVAYVGGVMFWAVNLKWLSTVTGPAYLILALYLAVYFGFFGLFAATAGNPFRRQRETGSRGEEALRSLAFAALNGGVWCGLEWLRGLLFTGFGWNGLGVAFHNRLPLAQGAELVGVAGLAFLPIFMAAIVLQVGARLAASAREGRVERHWDFAAAVLLLIGSFTFGVFRISAINRAPSDDLRVLLVQLDIPQVASSVLWPPEDVHAGYENATLEAFAEVDARNEKLVAAAEGEVELEAIDWVIWPEVVMNQPLFSDEGQNYETFGLTLATLEKMRAANVRNLVAGLWEMESEPVDGSLRPRTGGKTYNAMMSLNPEGAIATHRKQHLVIYGEFIPFVDQVAWLGAIYEKVAGVPWAGNLGRGQGKESFTLPGAGGEVRIIPSICFEDTVPRVARKFSQGGREVIVNITNDGWFNESEGSQQHFDNALFRSIELRRPMLRAANRGVTGVVSATGSLVDYQNGERQVLLNEEGKPFVRGSLLAKARVRKESSPTLYARAGDWFAVSGLLVGIGWALAKRKRLKKD